MALQHTIKYYKMGLVPYAQGTRLQQRLLDNLKKNLGSHAVLLLEHPPTYTLGRRQEIDAAELTRLCSKGAEYVRADRGGLTTYHGPGQLVVYPILNLNALFPGPSARLPAYVDFIEQVCIDVCSAYGVRAFRTVNPGVWVDPASPDTLPVPSDATRYLEKVAAIGVRNNTHLCTEKHAGWHEPHMLSTHGFALNCSTDLSFFDHIVPCGLAGLGVTSLSKITGRTIAPDDVIPKILAKFEGLLPNTTLAEEDPHTLLQD